MISVSNFVKASFRDTNSSGKSGNDDVLYLEKIVVFKVTYKYTSVPKQYLN